LIFLNQFERNEDCTLKSEPECSVICKEFVLIQISMPDTDFIVSKSELYDKYAASLFGIILKVCPDREQAGEILQCVFRKLCRNNENIETPGCRRFTRILRVLIEQCEESLHLPKAKLISVMFPLTTPDARSNATARN
jgi:hypothetical protein